MDVNPQTDPPARSVPLQGAATLAQETGEGAQDAEKQESLFGFSWFLVKLLLAVLIIRSLVIAPFSIPSDSMLPQLWQGDYLIASKWPYGYSRYSLPFNAPLIPGRIFESAPQRGDIVIFKHPVDEVDYVKRVIGVPGDTVGMINGQVVLNGALIPQERLADFAIPLSAITDCGSGKWRDAGATGQTECLVERSRETLPSGRQSQVINMTDIPQDTMAPITVPEGRVFVMGDNRDQSADSRFAAEARLGVGLVPMVNLVGRAEFIVWSTDGSAQWIKPWTWFSAARWDRIGKTL